MTAAGREQLERQIREIVTRHEGRPEALLPILSDTQKALGHVGERAIEILAGILALRPARIQAVASFHSFIDLRPRGRFPVRLCRTLSCMLAGRDAIARRLETDLGIRFGGTTADGMFSLDWVDCLGLCDQGPALMVGDRVYSQVTVEKVHEILEDCRRDAARPRPATPEEGR